jgi:hypothetical protein
MLIHVDSVFRSPLAVANKWRETYTDRFEAAPLLVPPKAEYFLVASELDIESKKPRWEAAITQLSIDPTIQEVGARFVGSVDELNGIPVVWPRNGLWIAKFGTRQFGLLLPGGSNKSARSRSHPRRLIREWQRYHAPGPDRLGVSEETANQGGVPQWPGTRRRACFTPQVRPQTEWR